MRFQNLVRRGCMDMSGTFIAEWDTGRQGTGRQGAGRQGAPQKRQKNRGANWELELDWLSKNCLVSRAARAERGGTQTL